MSEDQYVADGEAVGQGEGAPVSGEVTDPADPTGQQAEQQAAAPQAMTSEGETSDGGTGQAESLEAEKVAELERLVAERTSDLQRLQAEYVNYKRRVDRDRELARQGGVEKVVLDLLPVLDSIEMARSHDELIGGFKMVAEEIEKLAGRYGLEIFGTIGDPFDPTRHEALMHLPMEGVEVTTCSQVMQRGYTLHGKVLRPARVAVADPQ